MQMRSPVAISRRRTDLADALALGDRLTDFEAVERIEREMAVQREEIVAVLEDDDWSVIEPFCVVGERVDGAVKHSANSNARFRKQIDTEMNRAMFIRRMAATEGGRVVPGSRFVVSPDGNANAGFAHFTENDFGHRRRARRFSDRRRAADCRR